MRKTLLRLLWLSAAFSLAACTAFYQRQFEVAMDRPLSSEERDTIAQQYEAFMVANGYTPEAVSDARGRVVYFRIRDARSRVLPTSKVTEMLSPRVDSNGKLVLGLHRLSSYPPDDFTTQYVETFVKVTTKHLGETTGKALVLREVSAK